MGCKNQNSVPGLYLRDLENKTPDESPEIIVQTHTFKCSMQEMFDLIDLSRIWGKENNDYKIHKMSWNSKGKMTITESYPYSR